MFQNVKVWVGKCSAGAVALVAAVPAFAAGSGVTFDTTEPLALVADAQAFIVTVGLSVLTLFLVAKGIKWARKAG